jgi:hypothetical protein
MSGFCASAMSRLLAHQPIPAPGVDSLEGAHFRIFELDELQSVSGDVDKDRAWSARTGDMKGLFDGHGDIFDPEDKATVLCHGYGDAGDVGLLKAVASDEAGDYLACNGHQGHRVHPCGGDAGNEVRSARPRGAETDPDFASHACIGIGGMRSRLLVPDEEVLDLRIVVGQGIVEGQVGAAWIAPDVLTPL